MCKNQRQNLAFWLSSYLLSYVVMALTKEWRPFTLLISVGHKDEDAVAECVKEEGQAEQRISEGNEGKKDDLGASKNDNCSDRLSTADKGDERTEECIISDEGGSGRVEDEDNKNSVASGDENAEEGSEYPISEVKTVTSSTDGDQEGTIAEAQSGQQSCEVNDDKATVKMETESSSKLPQEKMEHCEVGKLYYAQLFKGINSRAIFCMCQHFPQYIKVDILNVIDISLVFFHAVLRESHDRSVF